jgi:hypothetical protein
LNDPQSTVWIVPGAALSIAEMTCGRKFLMIGNSMAERTTTPNGGQSGSVPGPVFDPP